MFNKLEHTIFIEDIADEKVDEIIIEYLCQGDITIKKYLSKYYKNPYRELNKVFKTVYAEKIPAGIFLNHWLFYLQNFKHCFSCKNILPLYQFSFNSRSWDKLQGKCNICNKYYSTSTITFEEKQVLQDEFNTFNYFPPL